MDIKKKNKLDLINDRIGKLKKQMASIIAKNDSKERKKQIKRLIKIGDIVTKYLGNIEPEEFEKVIKHLLKNKGADKL